MNKKCLADSGNVRKAGLPGDIPPPAYHPAKKRASLATIGKTHSLPISYLPLEATGSSAGGKKTATIVAT